MKSIVSCLFLICFLFSCISPASVSITKENVEQVELCREKFNSILTDSDSEGFLAEKISFIVRNENEIQSYLIHDRLEAVENLLSSGIFTHVETNFFPRLGSSKQKFFSSIYDHRRENRIITIFRQKAAYGIIIWNQYNDDFYIQELFMPDSISDELAYLIP